VVGTGIFWAVKILSWNVNGLRACSKTHFREWFDRSDADVVLIQELRAEPEQLAPDLVDLPGYSSVFFPASSKKGYSGVAAWVRDSLGPYDVQKGMGWEVADREGRVLVLTIGQLKIMGSYVFNGGKSDEAFAHKLEFYDRIRAQHAGWVEDGFDVAFLGDYNICHQAIDIADPVGNKDSVGFRPVERAKLGAYLDAGFADCFRRFHPGVPAQYTWWSNRPGVRAKNHGWRIDYATVSENLWPRVKRCWHEPQQMGSDHCPIGLELK
jgi:exodeoxyribonuclease III